MSLVDAYVRIVTFESTPLDAAYCNALQLNHVISVQLSSVASLCTRLYVITL